MPEGPEIRLAADRVAKVLVDRIVTEVEFGMPRLRRFTKSLAQRQVVAVDTRGKAMLTRFDNGLTIYSHNQLYGRWYTTRRPRMPKTGRQLRLALHTPTHSALLYSASDISVLTERQLGEHPFLRRLGPDILDPALEAGDIVERLAAPGFRNRALGSLYLDQGFLAGLGNYLRSEILFVARLDPWRKASTLSGQEAARLARITLTLSRRSYRTRGVITPPSLARVLKAEGRKYREYRYHVYGRDGLPCYECGKEIERRTMGSRGIFVCDTCQSAARR